MNFSVLLICVIASLFSTTYSKEPNVIIRPNGGVASRRLVDGLDDVQNNNPWFNRHKDVNGDKQERMNHHKLKSIHNQKREETKSFLSRLFNGNERRLAEEEPKHNLWVNRIIDHKNNIDEKRNHHLFKEKNNKQKEERLLNINNGGRRLNEENNKKENIPFLNRMNEHKERVKHNFLKHFKEKNDETNTNNMFDINGNNRRLLTTTDKQTTNEPTDVITTTNDITTTEEETIDINNHPWFERIDNHQNEIKNKHNHHRFKHLQNEKKEQHEERVLENIGNGRRLYQTKEYGPKREMPKGPFPKQKGNPLNPKPEKKFQRKDPKDLIKNRELRKQQRREKQKILGLHKKRFGTGFEPREFAQA